MKILGDAVSFRQSRLLLSLLMLTNLLCSKVKGAANANAREYRILCDLLGLKDAAQPSNIGTANVSVDNVLDEIDMLNVSTATESWINDRNGQLRPTEGDKKEAAILAWKQKIDQIGKETTPGQKPKYERISSKAAAARANSQLKRLHTTAAALGAKIKKEIGWAETLKAQIAKDLAEAAFGTGKTSLKQEDLPTTHANLCGGTSGNAETGSSIAADIICLCTASDGNMNNHCQQGTNVAQVNTPNTHAANAWSALSQACAKTTLKGKQTPEEIHRKLATFFGALGQDGATLTGQAGNFVLGKTHNNGCIGSSNDAACVNYATQLKEGGTGIPWANRLEAAATKLKAYDVAKATATFLFANLETLKAQAWQAYDDALTSSQQGEHFLIPTIDRNRTAVGPQSPDKVASAEKECNKKDKDTECKPPCTWDGEAKPPQKKCTLSEDAKQKEAEKANQETGGKDVKTTNTTGSDSFVINKAPLLLAFLLF
uniref:Variant surface glycoprotein 578 n=1 Tax=Trypanosoma brucei TaxID=5691 RepID=M4T0C8_9TRYP|nr:variant surface glycoprotein 578 [Trypanosoma brucei]